MVSFSTLYEFCTEVGDCWEREECIDRSDAEQLVRLCKEIPPEWISKLPVIQDVIEHADEFEDWDSGVVGPWPSSICAALEQFDKQYGYCSTDEDWEVFSLTLTGEREWKAFAETETLAAGIVQFLQQAENRLPDTQS